MNGPRERCPFTSICAPAWIQEQADLLSRATPEALAHTGYHPNLVTAIIASVEISNNQTNGAFRSMLERAPKINQRCGSCVLHKNVLLACWDTPPVHPDTNQ